jgi:Ran GTPase-activating protein 1
MKFSIADKKKRYETKEDISEIVDSLRASQDEIVEVDLSINFFSEEAIGAICEALEGCRNMKSINLCSTFTGLNKERLHQNLSLVSKVLMKHEIQNIDLSDNAISADFPEEFGNFVANSKNLYVLRINNCGLGEKGGDRLAGFMDKIRDKGQLRILEVAQNRFFTFPKELCKVIPDFTSLSELRVQYNTVDEDTMVAFLDSIGNLDLEVFDIRDNFLSEEGSRILGELYCKWSLRELRVGDCMMGDAGIGAFLDEASSKFVPMALPGDIEPRREGILLDLSYNDFGQDSVEKLVKFCSKNAIGQLLIFGNYFEDLTDVVEKVKLNNGEVIAEETARAEELAREEEIDELLLEKMANL